MERHKPDIIAQIWSEKSAMRHDYCCCNHYSPSHLPTPAIIEQTFFNLQKTYIMRKVRHLLLLPFVLFFLPTTAQVRTKIYPGGIPQSRLANHPSEVPEIKIAAPPNFETLLLKATDKTTATDDNRFAVSAQLDLDLIKAAKNWVENGYSFYAVSLNAATALNVSLQFSKFHLQENAVLSIYTPYEITESITSSENNPNNVWATRVYQGNKITLLLKIPVEGKDVPVLNIGNINFGYKNFGIQLDFGNIGQSAACNINAICPAGTPWNNERNSVAMIVANGVEQCTGSLLMNTCNTNIPYFLTANHCLGAGNVPNWVFQFQTLSADCAINIGWREDIQFNGCTLRANNAATDFALVQLNTTPPPGSGLVYSGWSRETAGHTSVTSLHHPQGDLMKIALDFDAPTRVTSAGVECWQLGLNQGIVQQGSSGAPYYNQNHQVIGQHWRRPDIGTIPDCNITVTLGGRFDNSWTGGGTNATRLSNWLDPSNSGALTTNTTNVLALAAPTAFTLTNITGATQICTSSTYGTNLPAGTNVTWSVSQPGSSLSCTNCPQTVLTLAPATSELLTATTTGCPAQTATLFVKDINFGTNGFSTSGIHTWCRNQTSTVSVNTTTYPGLTNFVWGNPPANWIKVTGGTPSSYIVLRSGSTTSPPTGSITVSATNGCGNIATSSHFMAISTMANCGTMRISPNPASSVINVELVDEATGETADLSQIKSIELVNKNGTIVYKQKIIGTSVSKMLKIPVKDLKNDIYTLRITDGTEWKSFKVIVQH